jgi:membrane protein
MNQAGARAVTLLKAIAHEIRTERVTFMAGSIAYNAFVSMLPLLLLLLAVVSTLGNEQLEQTLLGITNAAVNPGAGDVLVGELQNASTEVSVIGGAFLVWGALRIFRSLDAAFSDVYETGAENTFADQFTDGLVVLVSMAALLFVAVSLEVRLAPVLDTSAGWLVHRAVLVVGVGVTLVPIYYVFPDEDEMALVEVLPGVGVTAVGLVAFQSLFQLYLQYSSPAARDSILASILVFLTWLYFSGLILLVGGAVNAVLSNRSADVNVRPLLAGKHRDDGQVDAPAADADTVAAIERLSALLPGADDVDVVVDGETVSLSAPSRVAADVDPSGIPFVDDTVAIELRWTVEDEAAE